MSSTQKVETVELSSLTDQQKEEYLSERIKKFKLTIIVCCVYGIIALVMLILAMFTSWGNKVLYTDMFSFMITFIIGTIIIIIFLANEIYNFKPTKSISSIGYDAQMCPDYWKLEYVKEVENLDKNAKPYINIQEVNKNQFSYKCVLDKSLFPAKKFQEADIKKAETQRKNYKITPNNRLYVSLKDKSQVGINKDDEYAKFKSYSAQMSGYTLKNDVLYENNDNSLKDGSKKFSATDIPLTCDNVYPMYLSMMDKDNIEKNPSEPNNKYRCAYAKACGVPWTEAGCF